MKKMEKFVLVPDSFKGTLSSAEICDEMRTAILRHCPGAQVASIPVADGGEGMVECMLQAMPGRRVEVPAHGPFMEKRAGFYGVVNGGATAVIEMAACAGLPLVGENSNPAKTTTYGVGELMAHALDSGCRELVVGLGGSCTNDGGCGCAAALGARFINRAGEAFIPVGGTLSQIADIDLGGLHPALRTARVRVMCDIDNPLYGPRGAAQVFARQKGADDAMVALLDGQLRALGDKLLALTGQDYAALPGAGAAGGMGAGMAAFLGGALCSGIDTVLDLVGFEQTAAGADLIFTGEGKIDSQSLRGKVVCGVGRRAKALGVPVVAVVGDVGDGIEPVYEGGVAAVVSINRVAVDFSRARARSRRDLGETMDMVMRLLCL